MRGRVDGPDADEPYPGVRRTSFSTEQVTVTHYRFAPGASFPLHRHNQEQITIVPDGEVEMTVANAVHTLSSGDWFVVEPQVAHGITAGAHGAQVTAIIAPPRRAADELEVTGASESGA